MKTLDLDAILQKKNMALNEVSDALDKAITKAYTSGKSISDETKDALETCRTELKDASKEKVDGIIKRLQKISDKLAKEEEKENPEAPKSE